MISEYLRHSISWYGSIPQCKDSPKSKYVWKHLETIGSSTTTSTTYQLYNITHLASFHPGALASLTPPASMLQQELWIGSVPDGLKDLTTGARVAMTSSFRHVAPIPSHSHLISVISLGLSAREVSSWMSNVGDWAIDKQRNGILLQGQRPQKIPTLPNLSIKASFRTRKMPMAGFTYSDRAANLLRFFLRAPTPTSDAWQVAQEEESSSKSDLGDHMLWLMDTWSACEPTNQCRNLRSG